MRGVRIHNYTWIGDKVEIGEGSKIQAFAFIPNGVTIGKNVFVGPHVCFTNDKYPKATRFGEYMETIVEDNVSIGANATILCGITLHKGCKIAAGSVVTKDVGEGELWIGTSIAQ